MITTEQIKALRDKTQAGIADCRTALMEANGNEEEATIILRKKGMLNADKRASKVATEGAVISYIHPGNRTGVLLEVNCESDFVARSQEFLTLVNDIAMHIAATKPSCVSREDIDPTVLSKEREYIENVLKEDPKNSKKPPAIIEKILQGRLDKFCTDVVLLEQPFVKDPTITVKQLVAQSVSTIKENINVRRFSLYILGEGLEKKADDFAAEVAKVLA